MKKTIILIFLILSICNHLFSQRINLNETQIDSLRKAYCIDCRNYLKSIKKGSSLSLQPPAANMKTRKDFRCEKKFNIPDLLFLSVFPFNSDSILIAIPDSINENIHILRKMTSEETGQFASILYNYDYRKRAEITMILYNCKIFNIPRCPREEEIKAVEKYPEILNDRDFLLKISCQSQLFDSLQCDTKSIPGELNGKKVATACIVPVHFDCSDEIYSVVDELPLFDGKSAETGFREYVNKNLKYPMTDTDFQGRVLVEFIIEKNGTISNAKVLRGIFPLVDIEALRVINASPQWTPGKVRGEIVRTKFIFPVIFR
jgi:hypothetical protein